jgi:hypothetical protein
MPTMDDDHGQVTLCNFTAPAGTWTCDPLHLTDLDRGDRLG